MTTAEKQAEELAFTTEKTGLVEAAKALVITNAQQHCQAQEFIDSTYEFDKRVHGFCDDDCKTSHELWQSLTGKRKGLLDASGEARKVASDLVITYEEAETKKAEVAQAAEQAAAYKEEVEHKLERAQALEDVGAPEMAAEILEQPTTLPTPNVTPAFTPVAGLTTKVYYKGHADGLKGLAKFIKHVAKHPELTELLELSEGNVNRYINALNGNVNLPGVVLEKDQKKVRAGKKR